MRKTAMEVQSREKPMTRSTPGRTAWVMLFQSALPPSRCSMSSPTTSATNCRDCETIYSRLGRFML